MEDEGGGRLGATAEASGLIFITYVFTDATFLKKATAIKHYNPNLG